MKSKINMMVFIAALIAMPTISQAQDDPKGGAIAAPASKVADGNSTPSKGTGTVTKVPEKAKTAIPTPTEGEIKKEIQSETPATAGDILTGVQKVINDWRTLGWLAGVIALLQLLMKILKLGPIDEWFTVHKKKWIKPYIAAGIGALLGGFSTYATGAGVFNSIVAGVMIGATSVGWNELINKIWQPEKREA